MPDGCGGTLQCGSCASGEACTNAHVCEPVQSACVPKSCAELNRECGATDDGCGHALACGTCANAGTCDTSGGCNAPTQEHLSTVWAAQDDVALPPAITTATDGSIYLAAVDNASTGTIVVMKFDGTGGVKWRVSVGGAVQGWPDPITKIATTGLGNIFVASLGQLTKLDASGAVVWQRHVSPEATALAVDSHGGVAVSSPGDLNCLYERCETGRITQFSWDGNVQWEKDNGTETDHAPWEGIARTSGDALYALDGRGHLLKLDATGTQLWSHAVSGSEQVISLPSGDAVVLGYDGNATRIRSDGTGDLWTYHPATEAPGVMAASPQGTILISSNFKEGGCASFALHEISGSGAVIATRTFHNVMCREDAFVETSVAFTPSGAPLAAGVFNGTVDFGTGAKTASGGADDFLLRLAP
ncbi:MAG: PQQ-binding-like beta-propeller repeat protein [Myxococcaceae bacterium]